MSYEDKVLSRLMVDFNEIGKRHRTGKCWICEYWLMVGGKYPWNGRHHAVLYADFEWWFLAGIAG